MNEFPVKVYWEKQDKFFSQYLFILLFESNKVCVCCQVILKMKNRKIHYRLLFKQWVNAIFISHFNRIRADQWWRRKYEIGMKTNAVESLIFLLNNHRKKIENNQKKNNDNGDVDKIMQYRSSNRICFHRFHLLQCQWVENPKPLSHCQQANCVVYFFLFLLALFRVVWSISCRWLNNSHMFSSNQSKFSFDYRSKKPKTFLIVFLTRFYSFNNFS